MQMYEALKAYNLPDEKGHFGPYGGVFVSETLIHALDELRNEYEKVRTDPAFIAEFESELNSQCVHCRSLLSGNVEEWVNWNLLWKFAWSVSDSILHARNCERIGVWAERSYLLRH